MNYYGNCWAVLGLPGPASERDVKRSYARLLKQTRPEDDADGFQRLREAYEAALAFATARGAADDRSRTPIATVAGGASKAGVPVAQSPLQGSAAAPEDSAPDEHRCEAEAARAHHDDWMGRLWQCNDERRAAAVPGLLDAARAALPSAGFAELEAALRRVCAGDPRVSGGFFRAVDAALGWAGAPPALGGEAARLDLALQLRREHWGAQALLQRHLDALRDALAAGKWEVAAQRNAELQAALENAPLGWREWVQQGVVVLVRDVRGMPAFLIQRLADAWGSQHDVIRRQADAGADLVQYLEGERFWAEIEGIRAGRVSADWHYRRAVVNLFPRWRWQGLWRWRALYGLQQQMSRDLLEIMQQRFPWLLQRLHPGVVAFWLQPRPALGLYPEYWILLALFLCLAIFPKSLLTSPPPGAAWLLPLGYLLFVASFLALRLWGAWRWACDWRSRLDTFDRKWTLRLLPSRWRHAVDQHFRIGRAFVRGIVIGFLPGFLLGMMNRPDEVVVNDGNPWPYIFLWWGGLAVLVAAWRLFEGLRGRLPALPLPGVRYRLQANDRVNRDAPWISRLLIVVCGAILVASILTLQG